ncbi:hypothetical protein FVE85_6785 [Porphyridium purpureum]|uniref:Methyltransferase domain-containing protein n=1 Tax=Porphyridium purpureum TaxID=35688 RepID=A0A5J4Z7W7_PORPP|nr:hypothetical protein FVE85_6785 [Porphyridium purpureum]|eukprot:POR1737..scf295_1
MTGGACATAHDASEHAEAPGGASHSHHEKKHDWQSDAFANTYDSSESVRANARNVSASLLRRLPECENAAFNERRAVIIDVGAGPGHALLTLAPYATALISVDYSQPMAWLFKSNAEDAGPHVSERAHAVIHDFESETQQQVIDKLVALSPDVAQADVTICVMVAHHAKHLDALHAMLCAITKPRGTIVYFDKEPGDSVPGHTDHAIVDQDMLERKGVHHAHGFSRHTMKELVERHGGTVLYADTEFTFDFGRSGRDHNILAVYARNKA